MKRLFVITFLSLFCTNLVSSDDDLEPIHKVVYLQTFYNKNFELESRDICMADNEKMQPSKMNECIKMEHYDLRLTMRYDPVLDSNGVLILVCDYIENDDGLF